jgi:hypothetical protein
MIIDWSLSELKEGVNKIGYAESDPRMDGFVTWGCKQDLYQLLWHVEDTLDKCSTYAGEDEFVRAREKQQTIKALKGDLNA